MAQAQVVQGQVVQAQVADDARRLAELQAKQRRCASCVGHSAIVAKSGYSEVEWEKAVGQSRCDACIWRENYNRQFAALPAETTLFE
jgi:hypothetical protein